MKICIGFYFTFFTGIIFSIFPTISSSRVLELSDKFIDISEDGMWFVKFYAPWCAHCKRLEPVWAHVAQSLYNTPVKVAKVDCTRFPTVGTYYNIRAYPTLIFIKGASYHEYKGDRIKEDMVQYAIRMSQPAIQRVSHADSLGYLKEAHPVFFGFVGKQHGVLWDLYAIHAESYHPHTWFYAMSHEIIKNDLKPPNDTAIFVYKEDDAYFFEGNCNSNIPYYDVLQLNNTVRKIAIPYNLSTVNQELLEDKESLKTTLGKWINTERFGLFPKITRANIVDLMDTEKYLVIAVLSENKLNEITQAERDFRDMIEGIIRKRKHELHSNFQFGWLGNPDVANSIAMTELTVPHLIVLNSNTSHHHLPDDEPVLMTPEAVSLFLDQIYKQQAPAYGGNNWPVQVYRGFYEMRSAITSMWRGNPVLTSVVFGLPLGFLSLICYSMCCADILDADEDDVSESHEKND